jgi:hypothetical protein
MIFTCEKLPPFGIIFWKIAKLGWTKFYLNILICVMQKIGRASGDKHNQWERGDQ